MVACSSFSSLALEMSILFFSNLFVNLNGRGVVVVSVVWSVLNSVLTLSISIRFRIGSLFSVRHSCKYFKSERLALMGRYSSLPWILSKYLS